MGMSHLTNLVIIDYLQLMNCDGRHDSRQQEISEISRNLKLLAKELQIPVIALSQLSRASGGKQYKVSEGDELFIEKIEGEVGNQVELPNSWRALISASVGEI